MARIEEAGDTESICAEVADIILQRFDANRHFRWEDGSLSTRVMNWIEHHYSGPASIRDAARAVGSSVSAISHQLPRETGKSYSQLRMDVRIAEAKRLLATSELSISEIAVACGFSDQSHLSKALKQSINLAPGQFRRMLVVSHHNQ